MGSFQKDFELRRVIFGLDAIVNTPMHKMPKDVNQKLPQIWHELTLFIIKMHHTRVLAEKENEITSKGN